MALYRSAKSLVEGQTPSWREVLYTLPFPRTFIFVEHSLPDPDLEVLRKQGVHVEVVPKAGHSMAWENPPGLVQAIRVTLDRHW